MWAVTLRSLSLQSAGQRLAFGLGIFVGGGACTTLHATPDAPELCGTYRLVESDGAQSGHLIYEADGTVSSHTVRHGQYVGFSGKWWLHNARTAYAANYPPHDGDLVEHEITAASDVRMVGKKHVQRFELSQDGKLTCSVVELRDGESQVTRTTRWRRVLCSNA